MARLYSIGCILNGIGCALLFFYFIVESFHHSIKYEHLPIFRFLIQFLIFAVSLYFVYRGVKVLKNPSFIQKPTIPSKQIPFLIGNIFTAFSILVACITIFFFVATYIDNVGKGLPVSTIGFFLSFCIFIIGALFVEKSKNGNHP